MRKIRNLIFEFLLRRFNVFFRKVNGITSGLRQNNVLLIIGPTENMINDWTEHNNTVRTYTNMAESVYLENSLVGSGEVAILAGNCSRSSSAHSSTKNASPESPSFM